EDDVGTADQLAVDVELRIGRPVRILLERLAQLRILEDVHMRKLGACGTQRSHGGGRESALRKVRRSFHIEHDGAGGKLRFDAFGDVSGSDSSEQGLGALGWGLGAWARRPWRSLNVPPRRCGWPAAHPGSPDSTRRSPPAYARNRCRHAVDRARKP